MKLFFVGLFIGGSLLISLFFTLPQYNCTADPLSEGETAKCDFDGIKALRQKKIIHTQALASARDLEKRRNTLDQKFNAISDEDRKSIESLIPNNVDNIKLVLELETIAKRHGIVIESPKLESTATNEQPAVNLQAEGAENAANRINSSTHKTFTVDFEFSANYQNIRNFISDLERNLRLIEIVSFDISVPSEISSSNNRTSTNSKKVYPPGVYLVNIRATIYYLNPEI